MGAVEGGKVGVGLNARTVCVCMCVSVMGWMDGWMYVCMIGAAGLEDIEIGGHSDQ